MTFVIPSLANAYRFQRLSGYLDESHKVNVVQLPCYGRLLLKDLWMVLLGPEKEKPNGNPCSRAY
ncbi:MAG: hypothetical protein P8179_15055, partial [Candidatus Thiodiazotropha sp.]